MNEQSMKESGDENLLLEYASVLVKHWPVILSVTLITFFISVVLIKFPVVPPVPFPYRTVIEVGMRGGELLESRAVITEKMKNVYLATALTEHALQEGYDDERYQVELFVPDNSNMIIMKSFGKKEDEKSILTIMQKAADGLIMDHTQLVEFVKKDLQGALSQANEALLGAQGQLARAQGESLRSVGELDRLKEAENLLPVKKVRIDNVEALITKQIEELMVLVAQSQDNREIMLSSAAGRDGSKESVATTLLLIDSGIQENRNRLNELEHQLTIGIKDQRNALDQELLDNRRNQLNQQIAINNTQLVINEANFKVNKNQLDIENVQFKIDNIKSTKIVVPPSRLLKGNLKELNTWMKIVFFSILGLILGIIGAFFTEFVVKARQYIKNQQG